VRKTTETLETRQSGEKEQPERNAQREDIDEVMGEGGGDEEEDGECEDGYEDGHGSGCSQTTRNTTEKGAQLLLQNWCSAQDNCRQRS
jgi:hypothetical protein